MPLIDEIPTFCPKLIPFLPEGLQTKEELITTITSPQFKASLRAFSSALMGDDLNSLFANFGLNPMDGMTKMTTGDGIGAFLDAIIAAAERGELDKEE